MGKTIIKNYWFNDWKDITNFTASIDSHCDRLLLLYNNKTKTLFTCGHVKSGIANQASIFTISTDAGISFPGNQFVSRATASGMNVDTIMNGRSLRSSHGTNVSTSAEYYFSGFCESQ